MGIACIHGGRKLAQSFVEVVHLGQNANSCQNDEDISRRVCELVIASQGQLDGNSKSLDRHDRNRSDSRADRKVDEGVLLSILWSYLVDHGGCKYGNSEYIDQEA